jgi:E3 ubiquitin-protein ligase RLIM
MLQEEDRLREEEELERINRGEDINLNNNNNLIELDSPNRRRILNLLENLPEFPYIEKERYTQSDIEECVICLENFRNSSRVKLMNCNNHIFHSICIRKWIKNHDTCPICKKILE